MLDPTTLPCCGKSFCRGCLRRWIRTSVHTAGVPRCPGGCTAKLPVRLPARSQTLRDAIEQLLPRALARRQEEAREDEAVDGEVCYGSLQEFQEVAANRDIIFGSRLGVRQGTPGIVIGNFSDGLHVTVRFDEREDGSELCVNVLPEALMAPLPGGFRLGQRVAALYDLLLNDELGVRLGTIGTIVGRLGDVPDRLLVLFDARVDGRTSYSDGPVSVSFREVQLHRPLVGGFFIAQRVQSAMNLIVGDRVVVRAGTCGSVLAEFSDTRLTVTFDCPTDANDASGSGHNGCFNVLPMEIRPWCEPPADLPLGCSVEVVVDLFGASRVLVPAGTRGVVLGGVDEAQVFVAFEACEDGRCPHAFLAVYVSVLQKVSSEVDVDSSHSGGGSAPGVQRSYTWPSTAGGKRGKTPGQLPRPPTEATLVVVVDGND